MSKPLVDTPSRLAADRVRARLMAVALGRLLDRVRGSREVLLHLAALERGLADRGLDAIASASERTLTRICAQLGSLPLGPDTPELHDLLDLVEAGMRRQQTAAADDVVDIERTIVVSEISHSTFMAAQGDEVPTVAEARL